MARKIRIAAGQRGVAVADHIVGHGGDVLVLTDAQWAKVSGSSLVGTVILDQGATTDAPTHAEPGDGASSGGAASGAMLFKGAWDGATAYAVGDVVTKARCLYVAKASSTGVDPAGTGPSITEVSGGSNSTADFLALPFTLSAPLTVSRIRVKATTPPNVPSMSQNIIIGFAADGAAVKANTFLASVNIPCAVGISSDMTTWEVTLDTPYAIAAGASLCLFIKTGDGSPMVWRYASVTTKTGFASTGTMQYTYNNGQVGNWGDATAAMPCQLIAAPAEWALLSAK
jgi:hypothetical protein